MLHPSLTCFILSQYRSDWSKGNAINWFCETISRSCHLSRKVSRSTARAREGTKTDLIFAEKSSGVWIAVWPSTEKYQQVQIFSGYVDLAFGCHNFGPWPIKVFIQQHHKVVRCLDASNWFSVLKSGFFRPPSYQSLFSESKDLLYGVKIHIWISRGVLGVKTTA